MESVVEQDCFFCLWFCQITSHLSGLNAINHSLSQVSSFERSDWRAWQSVWFETVRYIMVSSAKSLMFTLYHVWHIIYTKETDRVPTPDMTGQVSDSSPSSTTCWVLFERKDPTQLITSLYICQNDGASARAFCDLPYQRPCWSPLQ